VALNGEVRLPQEKRKIAAMAHTLAGRDYVVDDFKVAPPKS